MDARSGGHRDRTLLEDLAIFERFGRLLHGGETSLRRISAQLGVGPSVVNNLLRRLEERYGKLVYKAKGMAGTNELTRAGSRLLEEMARWNQWRPEVHRQEISVAFNHSLLSNNVFRGELASFERSYRSDISLSLRIQTRFAFDDVVRQLQAGDIDFAILWGTDYRLRRASGLYIEELKPEFDVVFIAPTEDRIKWLEDCEPGHHNIDLTDSIIQRRLEASRLAVLREDGQPFFEHLPAPDYSQRGDRVELDSIDTVVGCVASGLTDCGLIVAIYPELDRIRSRRQLVYSKPVCVRTNADKRQTGIRLTLFVRKPGPSHLPDGARILVERLQRFLATEFSELNRPASAEQLVSDRFPGTEWLEDLRFGYYIDTDKSGERPIGWHWEQVSFWPDHGSNTWKGVFKNCRGDNFAVTGKHVEDIFIVEAGLIESEPKGSSKQFASVFTWCSRQQGVMVGTWSGQVNQQPCLYATVLSHRRMSFQELNRIARQVLIATGLNTDIGYQFDEQPESPSKEFMAMASARRRRANGNLGE